MKSIRLAAALAAASLCVSGIVLAQMALAQGAKLNDAQIAHIAYTAGQLDISAAELAKQKGSSKDVRAFADGHRQVRLLGFGDRRRQRGTHDHCDLLGKCGSRGQQWDQYADRHQRGSDGRSDHGDSERTAADEFDDFVQREFHRPG